MSDSLHHTPAPARTFRLSRRSRALRVSTTALCSALLLAASCDGPATERAGDSPLTLTRRTPIYRADVVRSFPHDTGAYTQGLLWHNGQLYESTGQVGASNVRRVNMETGAVEQQRDLPAPHFGEGITILGDKLYQLTWQTGKAFVYDVNTFAPLGEFAIDGEGWGITTIGSELIMSDGSATLRYLNPETFEVTRRVTVMEQNMPVRNLNELEMVKGELWANVWTTDKIARIDPQTGAMLGWIDLAGLLPQNERAGTSAEVLNGIAYDAEGDRILVTGKYWPRLYQIRLRAAE